MRWYWSHAKLRPLLLTLAVGPIGQAENHGLTTGAAARFTTVPGLLDDARLCERHGESFSSLLTSAGVYSDLEELQSLYARLWNETGSENAAIAWLQICLRFPLCMDSFHNLIVAVHRQGGPAAVRAIIEARFSHMPDRLDQLLAFAEACDLAEMTVERRAAFERLAQKFGRRRPFWIKTASCLDDAFGIDRSLIPSPQTFASIIFRWLVTRKSLQSKAANGDCAGALTISGSAGISVRALDMLFDRAVKTRQATMLARRPLTEGALTLLTGSLGAGGAERQLVNTAIGLSGMAIEKRMLGDGFVLDSVNVVARSLRHRKDGMFFLSELSQAGVPVRSYRELPDFGGNLSASAVRQALATLGLLPWSTAEAVIKLTDWFRITSPQVVHIWQDGLIYAVGLAALLAGVPRIVLSGRSAPPPDRRERYPVEYDIIYKSLLQAPGVRLSVNSHYAATRYARWLGVDASTIAVIPNGVSRPSREGDLLSISAYTAFAQRTDPSGLTIGAVMRLDEVKRPLLWIDTAASLVAKRPDARFIIVGDGPLRGTIEKRADALGVAGRCLFVGRSANVGYWLSKMDILMLLSGYEGLPNALIEAQAAGVPVITTSAGGAPETLIPGRTGMVTRLHPTPDEVAEMISGLADDPCVLKYMGRAAEVWANHAFPISRMLSSTLELYSAAATPRISPPEPTPAIKSKSNSGAARV